MAAVALYMQETSIRGRSPGETVPQLPSANVAAPAAPRVDVDTRSLSLSAWKTAAWSSLRSEMVKSGPTSSRQKRSAWRAQ